MLCCGIARWLLAKLEDHSSFNEVVADTFSAGKKRNVKKTFALQANHFHIVVFSCFDCGCSNVYQPINKCEIILCWFAGLCIVYGKCAQQFVVRAKYRC